MTNTRTKQLASFDDVPYNDPVLSMIRHTNEAKWLANLGNPRWEYVLGDDYYYGALRLMTSFTKANYWFRKAADQGYAGAEINLAYAYYHGYGVPQNTMTAITWWKKVVAQGGYSGMKAKHYINIASTAR
ncbi:MAG: tetratricopeptide repeat protein [Acidithiobacillus sp.]|nr:tetratricopeptide repeat protein [Acidithiobacillus sp.]